MAESGGQFPKGRRRLAGYELIRRLGRGAMGVVFLARQISMDRSVAIKVLAPRLARNDDYLRRFQREARSAARLNHTNIVGAIQVGEADGYHFFVMEYVEGQTVSEVLEERGVFLEDQAIGIAEQVALALDHAHQNGIVHRDVKPANIVLTRDGVAKLCDLGLAKEVRESGSDTQQGQTLGTPDYISPEQARGDASIDIRTDIYSLGASLYQMLTGRVPFPGPNPAVVMSRALTEQPESIERLNQKLTPGLVRTVRKMMSKSPKDRQQNPAELLAEFKAIRSGVPSTRIPPLIRGRGRARRKRR